MMMMMIRFEHQKVIAKCGFLKQARDEKERRESESDRDKQSSNSI